jgi:tetratricopeptide (TPR) repeat protein
MSDTRTGEFLSLKTMKKISISPNSLFLQGLLFYRRNQFKAAAVVFQKALESFGLVNDYLGQIKTMYYLGLSFEAQNRNFAALHYYKNSLAIALSLNYQLGIKQSSQSAKSHQLRHLNCANFGT